MILTIDVRGLLRTLLITDVKDKLTPIDHSKDLADKLVASLVFIDVADCNGLIYSETASAKVMKYIVTFMRLNS